MQNTAQPQTACEDWIGSQVIALHESTGSAMLGTVTKVLDADKPYHLEIIVEDFWSHKEIVAVMRQLWVGRTAIIKTPMVVKIKSPKEVSKELGEANA